MALVWDCSNCLAGTAPCNDEESAWLERLGLGSGMVKMDVITVDNVSEWLFRFRLVERLWPDTGVEPMSVAAIERWLGLSTNVTPMPRTEWVSSVAEHVAVEVLMNLQCELLGV